MTADKPSHLGCNALDNNPLTALIELNPRYLIAGFKTQAPHIRLRFSSPERKAACLLEVVASHIRRHGHTCYASNATLTNEYNAASCRYNVAPISERTVKRHLSQLVTMGLLTRFTTTEKVNGESFTFRHLTIDLQGLCASFSAVFNYAANRAQRFIAKQKCPSVPLPVSNSSDASSNKAWQENRKDQNGPQRSKDPSKEGNKNKASRRLPFDHFLVKFFKRDANEMKSLQVAARKRILTASGAKRMVTLFSKYGYRPAVSFLKYLNALIHADREKGQPVINHC